MFGRLLFPAVLVAAITIPYFAVRETNDNPLAAWWNSMWTTEGTPQGNAVLGGHATPTRLVTQRRLPLPEDNYLPSTANSLSPILPPHRPAMAPPTTLPDGTPAAASPDAGPREVARAPSLGGPPAESVAEILRFDINPQWVLDRWPRVSTQLALTNLQGLRVPWVSGTRVEDLTGSLTYYFDEQQQVQRLGFQGHTGDPATLITTMTQHFGLQAEPASGGGMYLARSDGQPTSVLRIRYAPVIRSSDLRGSYEIRFELNRPDSGLSREMQALLKADQKVRQWLPVEPKLPEDGPDGKPRPTNNASVENGPPDKTDPTNQPPAPPPALASPATPLPPAETSSPPAQTGGSGPRWPYPGARHDRGF